jgi:hypothetical protein
MRYVLPLAEEYSPLHASHRQGLKGRALFSSNQQSSPTLPFTRSTMLFRLSFVTLILAAVSLGTPVKRDADTVGSDIEGLQVQVQTLDTSVNALPSSGGTPAQVLVSVPNGSLPFFSLYI